MKFTPILTSQAYLLHTPRKPVKYTHLNWISFITNILVINKYRDGHCRNQEIYKKRNPISFMYAKSTPEFLGRNNNTLGVHLQILHRGGIFVMISSQRCTENWRIIPYLYLSWKELPDVVVFWIIYVYIRFMDCLFVCFVTREKIKWIASWF